MFTEQVNAGMAWLDENHPGWENHIDTDSLRMSSGTTCVLGQLYMGLHGHRDPMLVPGWYSVLEHFGIAPEDMVIDPDNSEVLEVRELEVGYGFMIPDSVGNEYDDDYFQQREVFWNELRDTWKLHILARQVERA